MRNGADETVVTGFIFNQASAPKLVYIEWKSSAHERGAAGCLPQASGAEHAIWRQH